MPTEHDLEALFADLSRPFPVEELEWKPGALTKDKTKALAMVYVQNRAIMSRLDEVVKPWNWRVSFHPWRPGEIPIQPPPKRSDGPPQQRMAATLCRLEIRVGDVWIAKEDIADETDLESSKGGASSSMKRAAVQWNIGRELYALDAQWAPYDAQRKRIDPSWTPRLPGSPPPASPPPSRPPAKKPPKGEQAKPQAVSEPPKPPRPEWFGEPCMVEGYFDMPWQDAWDREGFDFLGDCQKVLAAVRYELNEAKSRKPNVNDERLRDAVAYMESRA